MVQYYRWFQAFERDQNEARIKNHLAILSDFILITTSNGPLRGKEGMRDFLNYVKSWKNAHHIGNTDVKVHDNGSISIEANIFYQNILPEGKQNEYKLYYSTRLTKNKDGFHIYKRYAFLLTTKDLLERKENVKLRRLI